MKSATLAITRRETEQLSHHIVISRDAEKEAFEETLQLTIEKRAYELYMEAGGAHGNDREHWLRAEKEVLHRVVGAYDNGAWLHARIEVAQRHSGTVCVCVDNHKVLVAVASTHDSTTAGDNRDTARRSYYLCRWPAEADASTASAYLKNNTVTVEAKKLSHQPRSHRAASGGG
jgi:hypothetical protein